MQVFITNSFRTMWTTVFLQQNNTKIVRAALERAFVTQVLGIINRMKTLTLVSLSLAGS